MQIQIDDLLEGVEIEIGETLVWSDGRAGHVAARAVDEAVDAAPFREHCVPRLLQRRAVEHVGDEADALGVRSDGAALGERGVEFFLAAAEEGDARALGCQVVGGGACEDAGGSGDDEDAVGKGE